MSERKAPGESWESFADRRIREAQERGEFDDLPGRGKPLPGLDRPRDELWWVRRKLKDEGLSYVPPALQVRKDVEDARRRVTAAREEAEVRAIVADVNDRIRLANRSALHGPASTVAPIDEEDAVARWRTHRRSGDA